MLKKVCKMNVSLAVLSHLKRERKDGEQTFFFKTRNKEKG